MRGGKDDGLTFSPLSSVSERVGVIRLLRSTRVKGKSGRIFLMCGKQSGTAGIPSLNGMSYYILEVLVWLLIIMIIWR